MLTLQLLFDNNTLVTLLEKTRRFSSYRVTRDQMFHLGSFFSANEGVFIYKCPKAQLGKFLSDKILS